MDPTAATCAMPLMRKRQPMYSKQLPGNGNYNLVTIIWPPRAQEHKSTTKKHKVHAQPAMPAGSRRYYGLSNVCVLLYICVSVFCRIAFVEFWNICHKRSERNDNFKPNFHFFSWHIPVCLIWFFLFTCGEKGLSPARHCFGGWVWHFLLNFLSVRKSKSTAENNK